MNIEEYYLLAAGLDDAEGKTNPAQDYVSVPLHIPERDLFRAELDAALSSYFRWMLVTQIAWLVLLLSLSSLFHGRGCP